MNERVIVIGQWRYGILNVGVQLFFEQHYEDQPRRVLQGQDACDFQAFFLYSKASVDVRIRSLSAWLGSRKRQRFDDATIKGKVDHLVGLKENVIIGS
ncbi:hypothetical protein [Dubosiella newyorkensis]|uniref:hypothetical protein n=1 Tax=Dubosiella newyorkensis TaxID=1862672 RepID=UPI003F68058A